MDFSVLCILRYFTFPNLLRNYEFLLVYLSYKTLRNTVFFSLYFICHIAFYPGLSFRGMHDKPSLLGRITAAKETKNS